MAQGRYASIEKVSNVVREALGRGATVEIDGLGSFRKVGNGYRFHPSDRPRVFLAYVHEDAAKASRIYEAFLQAGFEPWMDERKLLPGQNWARALRNALETSDFAVCCFSRNSIHKRGGFQAEIRYALEWARRLPLDDIFLLPVRLDECPVPVEVLREMQYVDLFPNWDAGIDRLFEAIRQQLRRPGQPGQRRAGEYKRAFVIKRF
jgi:hypothetical protein